MQGNGNDDVSGEWFSLEACFQNVPQRLRQRYAIGIFQMVNDFAKRAGEEQGRSRKVKGILVPAAVAAKTFDCGHRFAALQAERRLERDESRPALLAGGAPSTLQYFRAAYDAVNGEQEIENKIEQSALGKRKWQAQYSMRPSPGPSGRPLPKGEGFIKRSLSHWERAARRAG